MSFSIRSARKEDLEAADRVARVAFGEYQAAYPEWIPVLRDTGPMTQLALEAEVLVAEVNGVIAGTVGYVSPGRPRHACFPVEWAILRMMAVDPAHRGMGIARGLVDECAQLARQDGATVLALFTSPAMRTAVALYERAGFRYEFAIAPVMGMPADVYALSLW
jgi:ribosomal protein S18 acetylase RimI-like enzyme